VLYTFRLADQDVGIVPCIVGSSYAVLVAEQLFVSGCKLLISITSAGIISQSDNKKRFALITSSVRDEGTSYHYLPPEKPAQINPDLFELLNSEDENSTRPFFNGTSWTTDAPFRETPSAISEMKRNNITCVEMEAAALYALSEVKQYSILCFAHLTNSMAQIEGDLKRAKSLVVLIC
jgi:uridine phosphorylase